MDDTNIDLAWAFTQNRDRYLREWTQLLTFPSISTEPEHDDDCRACASWLADHLAQVGFESRLLETPSKPVVFAQRTGRQDKPTVLFYGHYDVQPVDPLENWTNPPFEPVLVHDRLYARGAEDNKGQFFYALKAMETLIQSDALGLTVKVVLEGEEESGSAGISAALPGWRDLLGADVLMVTDTNTVGSGAPTLIMGLRGIIHATVVLRGPKHDLHSGVHGGVAPNPAQALARLVAGLHGPDGRIAVQAFYESLPAPSERERELAAASGTDAEAYRADTGVPPVGGEVDFSPAERAGFRPSLDVNGIHAGYGGAGAKTIIPAMATAKLTARLPAGQDPQRCLQALVAHIEALAPEGLELVITEQGVGGPGLRLDPASPLAAKARRVLDGLTDHDTAFLWEGASIPVVSALAAVSGAEPLLAGFGCEADNAHAPDESFSLEQFRLGYLYVARMLAAL